MYLKTGTAQIKFPIFLRQAKTCNEYVWRSLGDGTKNKRNEQMEKLTKLVKKRSNSFCDGKNHKINKDNYGHENRNDADI